VKKFVVLLLFALVVCGCSQNSQKHSSLFNIPPPNVTHKLFVVNSSNISVHTVSLINSTHTLNSSRVTQEYIPPPYNWTKLRLFAGHVGWGYGYYHPLVIIAQNNTSYIVFYLNKSVNTTSDVLKYIYKQQYIYTNYKKLYVNGTVFNISKMVVVRKEGTS